MRLNLVVGVDEDDDVAARYGTSSIPQLRHTDTWQGDDASSRPLGDRPRIVDRPVVCNDHLQQVAGIVDGGNGREAAPKPLRIIPYRNNKGDEDLVVQNTLAIARLRPSRRGVHRGFFDLALGCR
jgi:hypothetical protein